jgi:hypothetical protein
VICVIFPLIGLMAGLVGSGFANTPGPLPDSGGPGGPPGPGKPEPVPDPPGGQLADADAGELTALRSG